MAYGEQLIPYDNTINMIEKTCFMESNIKEGDIATICRFKPARKDTLLINFCFEDITFSELELENQEVIHKMSKEKIGKILNKKKYTAELLKLGGDDEKLKETIKDIIKKEANMPKDKQRIVEETEKYMGKLIMKSIDEAVFIPVDNKEDADLKDYIPFQNLAKYLQGKGYAGIMYRSTKMNEEGLQSKNIVLFNPYDVEPIIGSMKVYQYDGKEYHILKNS